MKTYAEANKIGHGVEMLCYWIFGLHYVICETPENDYMIEHYKKCQLNWARAAGIV